MIRFFSLFLLLMPMLYYSFFKLYSQSEYTHSVALNGKAPTTSAVKPRTDALPLKREDLLDGEDKGWFPDFPGNPDDYYEEMDLPKRSEKDYDSTNS